MIRSVLNNSSWKNPPSGMDLWAGKAWRVIVSACQSTREGKRRVGGLRSFPGFCLAVCVLLAIGSGGRNLVGSRPRSRCGESLDRAERVPRLPQNAPTEVLWEGECSLTASREHLRE